MISRIQTSLMMALNLSIVLPITLSFSPSTISPPRSFSLGSTSINSEDDALWLLSRAKDCATSGSCSVDEAEGFLRDVVRVQSSCVAGTLTGQDVCHDVGLAAEVVAGLRMKISNANSVGASDVLFSNGSLALRDSPSPLRSAVITFCVLYAASVLTHSGGINSHSAASLDVVPFTPQEWWWSVRDGYLPSMLETYFKSGGLEVNLDDVPGMMTSPMTAKEWMYAAKDGYVGDAASHVFRNGGL